MNLARRLATVSKQSKKNIARRRRVQIEDALNKAYLSIIKSAEDAAKKGFFVIYAREELGRMGEVFVKGSIIDIRLSYLNSEEYQKTKDRLFKMLRSQGFKVEYNCGNDGAEGNGPLFESCSVSW